MEVYKNKTALLCLSVLSIVISRINSAAVCKLSKLERYQGLFVDTRTFRKQMAENSTPVYSIKTLLDQDVSPLPGPCGSVDSGSLVRCSDDTNDLQIQRSRLHRSTSVPNYGCCDTVMRPDIPGEVETLFGFSGVTLQVVHQPPNYQIIHEGTCRRIGADCGFHGTCKQKYRFHFLLVETPAGDRFVPVWVPNHCYCQQGRRAPQISSQTSIGARSQSLHKKPDEMQMQ